MILETDMGHSLSKMAAPSPPSMLWHSLCLIKWLIGIKIPIILYPEVIFKCFFNEAIRVGPVKWSCWIRNIFDYKPLGLMIPSLGLFLGLDWKWLDSVFTQVELLKCQACRRIVPEPACPVYSGSKSKAQSRIVLMAGPVLLHHRPCSWISLSLPI